MKTDLLGFGGQAQPTAVSLKAMRTNRTDHAAAQRSETLLSH